jgi:hypothetical protein
VGAFQDNTQMVLRTWTRLQRKERAEAERTMQLARQAQVPGPTQRCKKVANRDVQGVSGGRSSSRGRYVTPICLYAMVPRTGGYTHDVGGWDLSILQGPFSVAPCRTRPPPPRLSKQSQPLSRAALNNIRLTQHFDSSALGLVSRWLLIGYFPFPHHYLTPTYICLTSPALRWSTQARQHRDLVLKQAAAHAAVARENDELAAAQAVRATHESASVVVGVLNERTGKTEFVAKSIASSKAQQEDHRLSQQIAAAEGTLNRIVYPDLDINLD